MDYCWFTTVAIVSLHHLTNHHEAMSFEPGNTICVDESIVWWYSLGGQLINASLPVYMALDRKPKNGCDIQNSADGGVIVELKLVKVSGEELGNSTTEDVEDMLCRTKVVKELIEPWIYSGRLVCGDLYFVSFGCVEVIVRVCNSLGL